jgi:hypothetical protein
LSARCLSHTACERGGVMTDYLLWAMLLIGWVYAITEASIFAPVRIFIAEHLGRIA